MSVSLTWIISLRVLACDGHLGFLITTKIPTLIKEIQKYHGVVYNKLFKQPLGRTNVPSHMYRLYFQTFQGFRRKKILFNHKFPIKILCIKLSYVPQWWHFEFSNHLKSRLKNDHPMIMYVLFSGFWEEIKKKYFSHRILFLTFETDQFLFLAMWDFLILH
jgi:hypothetical protein